MCGRYALGVSEEQLSDYFHVGGSRLTRWSPSWNIAPTATIPIIIDGETGADSVGRIVGPARWSLTPTWANTLETPYPTFNARSESVSTKPTFRQALAHTRALIPASGYFEWHTDGKTKTPHYIYPADEPLFAFAGLYSLWGQTDQQVVTATILTREAPDTLAGIHPRSPVPLPTTQWSRWLDPHSTGDAHLVEDMVSFSQEILERASHHPVNPLRGDSPELIQPKP